LIGNVTVFLSIPEASWKNKPECHAASTQPKNHRDDREAVMARPSKMGKSLLVKIFKSVPLPSGAMVKEHST